MILFNSDSTVLGQIAKNQIMFVYPDFMVNIIISLCNSFSENENNFLLGTSDSASMSILQFIPCFPNYNWH